MIRQITLSKPILRVAQRREIKPCSCRLFQRDFSIQLTIDCKFTLFEVIRKADYHVVGTVLNNV